MSSQPMASAVNYQSNYSLWKKLMLNLITSHQLVGFVDGTIEPPPLPSPEEEQNQEQHRLWMRSDGLVKGWIFSTVTEEILLKKVRLKTAGELEEVLSSPNESGEILPELVSLTTAREVWIALENIPARSIFAPSKSESSVKAEYEKARMLASRYLPLYRAIRNGDWENANKFLKQEPNAVRDAITEYSETALMLAIGSSKRNHFVEKLMERMSPEDVARTDNFGLTALSKAVINGNNVAAKWLVKKNPELLNIKDRELGRDTRLLAVHYAAMRGNREMVDYLLKFNKLDGDPNPFEGQLDVQLLKTLVYGEHYDIASTFLQCYRKLASIHIKGDTPLKEISYRVASFRSGTHLHFFQRLIYSGIPLKLEGNASKPVGRDVENSAEGIVSPMGYLSQKLNAMFWDVAEKLVPAIKSIRETKLKHHRALKFVKDFCQEVVKSELSNVGVIFQGPLENAATLGICEIVEEILDLYPSGIYFENQQEQSFFQLAIENRQENVFNLIYQMDGNQDYFLATVDKFGNNALHTVGKFASRQQLSLQANVAGAALQIQRELQWFKFPLLLDMIRSTYYSGIFKKRSNRILS